MPVFESTARITRKYLMNKTKPELVDFYFELLRQNDKLEADVKRLRLAAGTAALKREKAAPSPAKPKR
ncbi:MULTISPECIES: hypothetical protein [unclassified Methylobacterium]|uniref:hypothetical protein n=1 Tax=unclassified Methylobacterium TaxID=2615210 RepID=UPI0011C203D2|nr:MULTISPECIES: hypothetical protein [unclassified Methylobacterium]QEE37912.1 hypothetical protein FVA80_02005 [Methylobacterium sp. WL1]TXN59382.1 hypothetical protein FV241_02405 [Methylobacterium sp. WL2]